MITVVREVISSTAHQLRGVGCPESRGCLNMHGHNWKIRVSMSGATLDENGMLMDFSLVKRILMEFDHSCLNEHPYFQTHNPTAEELARYFFEKLNQFQAGIRCNWVRIWETENCMVEWNAD
ncbi:6-carboxytetrahydropterin synthase QueD [bacterium (Candidatus Blackallbacteria) CG17_big_fil_post_rev_8_21_14_2_50_48_46]|uniref:6-carboxy-5,6,7,8-tetrahydropterin synthase n=1 Tax=bacterium (Candidatus Blackallbacteria) CG17_big_fil_post_rev_8_21_14_2_50_48_46 TaxID=2014261 RepID=A0A2M7G379_9BACT|nr:MAG: 6-carboxytetrahydropterin synthase QueD [bacterium (Candidatus Blackallbacteria) CG18_big_fil_WC_8_21_14_2_50_49_26]PIW16296.1 MAG: 6-carboxytetrahydropterin synthase QueD [bacterium (Candidatus Blackallbacteria) CG17_big_fil_post_rev_8_21_14_2_50_48_46]PIW45310.1 MAG: 6-carboxytetrahydropterin synthase QueD [bacterium (Candidatus Blackallbacteria) CG13_big_fil_rev_8_21_14_2_50_49_14]